MSKVGSRNDALLSKFPSVALGPGTLHEMMQRLALAAIVPAALCSAGVARGDGLVGMFNPGPLVSEVAGPAPAFGIGGEASFMIFGGGRKLQDDIGVGGFFQAQRYNGDHDRFALGAQVGSILGVELGYAYRTLGPYHAGLHSVHAAIFASAGFLVASIRTSIPLATVDEDGAHPSPGFELAFCLAFKYPIPLFGDPDVVGNLPSGRPLRDRGHTVVASVRVGRGYPRGPRPRVSHLTARDRERLARKWLDDALAEHASIASFVRLAGELAALGAPAALVRRSIEAAREETRHARMCFAVASAYAGIDLSPGDLPTVSRRAASLRVLADESLVDGCVGEGEAAVSAAEARSKCSDEAVRTVLDVIARDEAGHARLAAEVLALAASKGVTPSRAARDAVSGRALPF